MVLSLIHIYGYQYLHACEEKAIPYAQRWAELDPEDENAPAVIRECKAEIRKRQRSRKKKAKFVPGDTPFEGFDLTNFWDDNWYALKEYVSDPPSDRKSTRLNSSHITRSRMPSSA